MIGRLSGRSRGRATARLAGLGLKSSPSADPARGLALPAAVVLGLGALLGLRQHPAGAVPAAALVAGGAFAGLRALLGRQTRHDRRDRLAADLPVALDLIGACLAAGVTVADAVTEVGAVLDSDLARALAVIGRALRRGVPDAQAWALLDRPGAPPALVALARAAVRSAATGSALEPWIAELAVQTRADQEADAIRAAQRAGVLAVLPLGLCALPAYVLLAVVPAVAGLLRHLR